MVTTPLIVYKASAGSGKTFTLATEYIKLVVRNPLDYKKILAVTFTNKATEEMKVRILSQLYGIWKQLPSSDKYIEVVCRELDASREFVAQQAGIALSYLLHNYSYFRIGTIDAFFQSVLRNLARELDLTANLRIGLNDSQVEEMAIDELIENLSANDQILQWILKYIMESINDDRSWNIIRQVKTFGKTIFKDNYKTESKTLYQTISKPHFFDNYTKTLNDIKKNTKDYMKSIGDRFFEILNNEGLSLEDLAYGNKGFGSMFVKIQNGIFDESIISKRATDVKDAPEKWAKKTHPRYQEITALAQGELGILLNKVIEEQPVQWRLYQSAELTLRHLNQLRLLESIEKKVRELNENANRFLLSDTQLLLHELIKGSDSPFIFEKIGTQLEHIMIDEFQDTSTVQWKNFKVLLEETMSHEDAENLIVGDVKQSIYRWRSGDWRLLENIKSEFDHADEQLDIRSLHTNYRSERHIVAFNNQFFTQATELEQIRAYNDVEQQVPEHKGDNGFVNITLLSNDDYQEQMLNAVCNQVKTLLDDGIPQTDIAILVRANRLIPLIANYFMAELPEVTMVSDEAFRLDASPAIQVIILSLRLLIHPDDLITKAYLAKTYSKQPLHKGSLDEMLPKDFVEHTGDLLRMPLYELMERIYDIFHLNEMEGQSAYLCAFYDQVNSFVNEQLADIATFLKEWDENLAKKTIQSPDINGIRIISIHKSKGLEFPHVLIPFCDWKIEMSDTLWCRPQEAPFNELPLVPIDYSQSGMKGTIYEHDYQEEYQQIVVDNMNLLYVAFTRASKGLYVWGRRNGKGLRSTIIGNVLPLIADKLDGASLTGIEQENASIVFEYPVNDATKTNETSNVSTAGEKLYSCIVPQKEVNVFTQHPTPLPLSIKVFKQKVEFKQSNQSRQFAEPEEEDQLKTNYIQLGSVLHNVFSTICTKSDIDKALQRLELEGIVYDKNLTKEKIEAMIRKRIENKRVADWYDGRWQLFNECTIINVDTVSGHVYERRPDRVMTDGKEMIVVDFKFGKPCEEYHNQVKEYMQLLSTMGYQNISGYLWYVYSNEIEEVK